MAIATGTAILLAAVAGGGAAIYGASKASDAAEDATEAQVTAAGEAAAEQAKARGESIAAQKEAQDKAIAAQREAQDKSIAALEKFYAQGREDLAPWRIEGEAALGQLSSIFAPGGEAEQRFGLGGEFEQTELPGFFTDPLPDYEESRFKQVLEEQGAEAQARAQSATGRTASGSALKAAARFSHDLTAADQRNFLADQIAERSFLQNQFLSGKGFQSGERTNAINEYLGLRVNPLFNISQTGQSSAARSANLAGQTGGQQANTFFGTGAGTAGTYQQTGQGVSNAYLQTGANLSNIYTGAGQARAGGAINQANINTGLYGSLGNIAGQGVNQYLFYNWLNSQGGGGGPNYFAGASSGFPRVR